MHGMNNKELCNSMEPKLEPIDVWEKVTVIHGLADKISEKIETCDRSLFSRLPMPPVNQGAEDGCCADTVPTLMEALSGIIHVLCTAEKIVCGMEDRINGTLKGHQLI